jgi:hypothetical protein
MNGINSFNNYLRGANTIVGEIVNEDQPRSREEPIFEEVDCASDPISVFWMMRSGVMKKKFIIIKNRNC